MADFDPKGAANGLLHGGQVVDARRLKGQARVVKMSALMELLNKLGPAGAAAALAKANEDDAGAGADMGETVITQINQPKPVVAPAPGVDHDAALKLRSENERLTEELGIRDRQIAKLQDELAAQQDDSKDRRIGQLEAQVASLKAEIMADRRLAQGFIAVAAPDTAADETRLEGALKLARGNLRNRLVQIKAAMAACKEVLSAAHEGGSAAGEPAAAAALIANLKAALQIEHLRHELASIDEALQAG